MLLVLEVQDLLVAGAVVVEEPRVREDGRNQVGLAMEP